MSWITLESVVSSRLILNKPEIRKREGGRKEGRKKTKKDPEKEGKKIKKKKESQHDRINDRNPLSCLVQTLTGRHTTPRKHT